MRRAGDTQKAPRSGLKHLLQRVLIPPHPSLNLVCAPFSPLGIPCFVRYHCKKFSVRSIWSFPGAVPNSCFRQSSPAPSKNLVCAPTDKFSVRPIVAIWNLANIDAFIVLNIVLFLFTWGFVRPVCVRPCASKRVDASTHPLVKPSLTILLSTKTPTGGLTLSYPSLWPRLDYFLKLPKGPVGIIRPSKN